MPSHAVFYSKNLLENLLEKFTLHKYIRTYSGEFEYYKIFFGEITPKIQNLATQSPWHLHI